MSPNKQSSGDDLNMLSNERKRTDINFNNSSMRRTGALKYKTAFHSVQLRGVIANNDCTPTINITSKTQ